MDKTKVQTILDWPEPCNLKALQSFLGFANFYGKFIFNYSKKTCHLSSLTKKDIKYEFGPEAQKQFEALKLALTTDSILNCQPLLKLMQVTMHLVQSSVKY